MEQEYLHIKKGLQKEVLFMGLKAVYINYCIYLGLASIIIGLGLSTIIPTALALLITTLLILVVFAILMFYSKTYGAKGFVKKLADAQRPNSIKVSNSFETLLVWKNN
ncbi:DUF4133 domain-containing protein [Ulvibacterium marinum]|uniref:DUF4133 domain-containing protein n=1 Tax=Ulvibacterium marinum TaxID=2419782 RepID=A0A3B0CAG0_9FLAO|nr:DUF4133 domain-containing protein [Ulvibacterium marinum]RKN83475.1 DUF4133 domain-containing protein [Ulvibacterium marinum]